MPESILVIGAGGFIGRHLVHALAACGEHVIAASRSTIEFPFAHVETYVGDFQESVDLLPLIARSRSVIHLASASTPGSTVGDPLVELQANLRPTLSLLQAMQTRPQIKLIYVSSGGSLYATSGINVADEHFALSPRSYHGAGKAAAEHFVAAWCAQYGGAATIMRPSNIYGPGQTERAGFAVVPTALGKILRNEPMTIWGDGSAIRDYLYIDDFITLCLTVLNAPQNGGAQMLNASSSIGISLDDLFTKMETVTGRPMRRTYERHRAVDAPRVAIDSTAARTRFGWSPAIDMHEGLKRTWHWLTTTPH